MLPVGIQEVLGDVTFTNAFQGSGYLEGGPFSAVTLMSTLIGRKRKVGLVDYTHKTC